MTARSIRSDRPLDPVVVDILRAVAAATRAEHIEHMLVGATARDILLTHVLGIDSPRATRDIDFAFAVANWAQFDAVKRRLIALGTFREGGAAHRLYYRGTEDGVALPMDLLPFGGVARQGTAVAWPPDMKTIINTSGYDEVLAAAEEVTFAPDLVGKVVSLAGLAILKLVAWSDRGRENPKDAHDFIHLVSNYTAAGNFDRVYDEEHVIEAANYDPDLAGAYLLGKDIRSIASARTLAELLRIIDNDRGRLAGEMIKPFRHLGDPLKHVEARLALLRHALVGSPAGSI